MSDQSDRYLLRCTEIERELLVRFGDAMTLAEIAAVLRYPSTQAAHKARMRGTLPVAVSKMPPRRQWFASVRQVAEVLARLEIKETVAMT